MCARFLPCSHFGHSARAAQTHQPVLLAAMQRYGCQDFIEELDHLEKLAEMLPDSPVTESMAHTFMAKIQGCQSWSSESICEMLAKANQASRLPAALQEKILNTIQNLSMNTGSQLKLVNSGHPPVSILDQYRLDQFRQPHEPDGPAGGLGQETPSHGCSP